MVVLGRIMWKFLARTRSVARMVLLLRHGLLHIVRIAMIMIARSWRVTGMTSLLHKVISTRDTIAIS